MFMLKINKPMKVIHLQKVANQSKLNDALVIKNSSILLVKARKTPIV